jgi:NADH-quinone oxidoreductase subunit N
LFLVVLATLLKSAVLYQQNSASRALVTEGVVASYYALMWPALLVLPHFLFEVSSGIGEGVLQILALYTVKFILLFSAAVVVYHSYDYVAERRIDTAEYGVLMLLATAFLYLLILSTNLLAGFVCIMGFSLNTYTLLATDIHNAGRREASIKYFYLSAVSAGLLIYGIFLVYSIAGTLDYTALNNFFTNSNALNTEYELTTAISGICLILTGLSFKLSAFPGHL